jgi:hypothetical protein
MKKAMKKLLASLFALLLASPAWADSLINALSAGAALGGTEQIPMFQTSNPAVTTTPNAVKTFFTGATNTWSAVNTFSASNGIVYSGAAVGTQVACLGLDASNNVVKNAAACGSGGGTPAGPSSAVQFNNGGAFGGDASFEFVVPGQATLALGTITTNLKALTITGTWNAVGVTFDAPLLMNVTNTASAAGSILADIQQGGVSQLVLYNTTASTASPNLALGNSTTAGSAVHVYKTVDTLNNPTNYERGSIFWNGNTLTFESLEGGTGGGRGVEVKSQGQDVTVTSGGNSKSYQFSSGLWPGQSGTSLGFNADSNGVNAWNSLILGGPIKWNWPSTSSIEVVFYRDAASGLQAFGNGANAQTVRVYNTTDQTATGSAPTNFERSVMDWGTTANVVSIGSQSGGTGVARPVLLVSSGMFAAAGPALPACNTTAVANYPNGTKGFQAVVSDATAPTYNATYTSGGAVVAHVVCNGTNWVTQ